ncbi:MAG: translation initiation factor IF-3 [Mycoplasmataceae bacterium]|nr:translation initiation factor IF-3 [Mycoplasmataceae bacterium]
MVQTNNFKRNQTSNLNKKPNLINNEIKFNEFTLIDDKGNNLGLVKKTFALNLASEKELDVVLINTNITNPVCKLLDYDKYLYEQKRKAKDNKKNQTKIKIKEVKIKPQIAENDLSWNAKHIIKWIEEGCVVRILIHTPGRLSSKPELIFDVYNRLLALINDFVTVRNPLKMISSIFYEAVIEPKKGNKVNGQNKNENKASIC